MLMMARAKERDVNIFDLLKVVRMGANADFFIALLMMVLRGRIKGFHAKIFKAKEDASTGRNVHFSMEPLLPLKR